MTRFDDLSIDLLLKIFNYLSFIELFRAFFSLQKRLDNTIRDYSACISLSQLISYNIPQHFTFRCRTLILSGIDLQPFQMKYSYFNFETLRAVTFRKMTLFTLHSFIKILPMKQLESITIGRLTWHYYPIDIYKHVWSIIIDAIQGDHLRYLHLPYHIRYWDTKNLSFDFSVLKHATLEYVTVTQMLTFMSHTPDLHRFKACLTAPHQDLFRYKIVLPQLNHLTLNLQDEWSFKQVQQLLILCPYLTHLILKLEAQKETKIMFEPTTWQTLIEHNLSHLIFLRLRLNCIIIEDLYTDSHNYQASFNHATYWLQRQPHFQVTVNTVHRELFTVAA